MKILAFTLILTLFLFPTAAQDDFPASPITRCINLGNMLEAPNEGEWGLTVQEEYLSIIAEAGFDTVRIPIRWNAHTDTESPYLIDTDFMARVDEVVGWALDADLQVIVNIHHFDELIADPDGQYERFLAIWEQIAEHYQDYPETLMFEILNEPNGNGWPAERWNDAFQDVVENVIRPTNPERQVIVGPVSWNSHTQLPTLEIPADWENIIVTVHYYLPFQFTHQGAEWVNDSDPWLGTTWGERLDEVTMQQDFGRITRWAEAAQRPIFIGEFGAYSKADMDSRLAWTTHMRELSEANNIGWCYWEFASGFGIYDAQRGEFNALYEALIPGDA